MYLENRIPFYDELDYELLDFHLLWEMAEKFPPRVREMVDVKLFNPPSDIPDLFEKAAAHRAVARSRRALTLDKVLKVLRKRKPEFKTKYDVMEIGVFGSVARGEAKPGSDVDVVVKMETPDLFCMVRIKETLEADYGTEVDVTWYHEDMHSLLKETIDKEAVYA
ncbi:MAG: nucleotidyltransferase domain-containing protein [Desulfobulbaceae bacterium]|nr:nucleotidyltransferase domain-containing protein [Desulfobulbaceae bacterium]